MSSQLISPPKVLLSMPRSMNPDPRDRLSEKQTYKQTDRQTDIYNEREIEREDIYRER